MKIILQKNTVRHLVLALADQYMLMHDAGVDEQEEREYPPDCIGLMNELITGNANRDDDNMFEASDDLIIWLLSLLDSLVESWEKPKSRIQPEVAAALKKRILGDIEAKNKLIKPLDKMI